MQLTAVKKWNGFRFRLRFKIRNLVCRCLHFICHFGNCRFIWNSSTIRRLRSFHFHCLGFVSVFLRQTSTHDRLFLHHIPEQNYNNNFECFSVLYTGQPTWNIECENQLSSFSSFIRNKWINLKWNYKANQLGAFRLKRSDQSFRKSWVLVLCFSSLQMKMPYF